MKNLNNKTIILFGLILFLMLFFIYILQPDKVIRITFPAIHLDDMERINFVIERDFQAMHPHVKIVLDPVEVPVQFNEECVEGDLILDQSLEQKNIYFSCFKSIDPYRYRNAGPFIDYEYYLNAINIRMLTKRDLDIVWLPYIDDYAEKDAFLDLNKILDPKKTSLGFAQRAYNAGGKSYAVPLGFSIYVSFLSRKMLEEFGIKPDPNNFTWDLVLEISNKCAERALGGEHPVRYGIVPDANLFRIYAESNCLRIIDERNNRASINNPAFKSAVNYFLKIYNNYNAVLTVDHAQPFNSFANASNTDTPPPNIINCLEICEVPLTYVALLNSEIRGEKSGFLLFPTPTGNIWKIHFLKGNWAFGLAGRTRLPKAAVDYLKLLFSDSAQMVYYKNYCGMPSNGDIWDDIKKYEIEWFADNEEYFDAENAERLFDELSWVYENSSVIHSSPKHDKIWAMITDGLFPYFNGSMKLDAVLQKLEKDLNFYLQKKKY